MKRRGLGFGVVEILLVIVVIGLVGGAGWYLMNKQKDKTEDTQQNTIQTDQQDGSTVKSAEYAYESIQGYKLYENSDIFMQYPESWKQYELEDRVGTIFFESPDFEAYEGDEGPGPSAEAGQQLELIILDELLPEANYDTYIKNLEGASETHGGSFEEIKIDGVNAVISDIKSHGTYIEGVVFHNDKQLIFRLNVVDEYKPEVKELLESILETVQFK